MYRKQVNETSPMRILERSIHGGLGPGNLGVVMARAGVGKTALMVRIGIDDTMRDLSVLHVALDQSLEHAMGWYDALFEDLKQRTHLEDPHAVREQIRRKRVIQAFPDRRLSEQRLRKVVELYSDSLEFKPSALLIDGYGWEAPSHSRKEVEAFKAIAGELGAELWMTARTHREQTDAHPTKLVPPCAGCADLIDVAVFLEPKGQHVAIRLLKDHDDAELPETRLELDPDTMRMVSDGSARPRLPAQAFTLLSGGHTGAEVAFGETAEKWGVREMNFSYAGREPARRVSVVELGEDVLHEGEVSSKYIETHLGRSFPDTSAWKKLLDTIWHQVATAGQVFVVGSVHADGTVSGGTGWAAELAKHFHKPLFVFDEERGGWQAWQQDGWVSVEPPTIESRRFCGTGTQSLSDAGRAAVTELFERSFAPQAA